MGGCSKKSFSAMDINKTVQVKTLLDNKISEDALNLRLNYYFFNLAFLKTLFTHDPHDDDDDNKRSISLLQLFTKLDQFW